KFGVASALAVSCTALYLACPAANFEGYRRFKSPPLRHPVFVSKDSPRDSLKIRACSAQFASLAAPETGEFEAYREDWDGSSLMRISVVPRENTSHGAARCSPTGESSGQWLARLLSHETRVAHAERST